MGDGLKRHGRSPGLGGTYDQQQTEARLYGSKFFEVDCCCCSEMVKFNCTDSDWVTAFTDCRQIRYFWVFPQRQHIIVPYCGYIYGIVCPSSRIRPNSKFFRILEFENCGLLHCWRVPVKFWRVLFCRGSAEFCRKTRKTLSLCSSIYSTICSSTQCGHYYWPTDKNNWMNQVCYSQSLANNLLIRRRHF